jgi:hypothetical protein
LEIIVVADTEYGTNSVVRHGEGEFEEGNEERVIGTGSASRDYIGYGKRHIIVLKSNVSFSHFGAGINIMAL